MHTGTISFCDRIAFNIKSNDTKDDILGELGTRYGIRILQRHWFPLTPKNIEASALVCLRSNGNPYYLYLTRFEDTPIIYFIDKKVQPGYERPRIILARGQFSPELFDGTLLDGEMVKDTRGAWIFLINDLLALAGKRLDGRLLPERLAACATALDDHYRPDDHLDPCSYQIKKYVPPTRADVAELLDFSGRLPYTNRGLYFWPAAANQKPKLINFDETVIKEVVRKVKDTPDFILPAAAAPVALATAAPAAPTPAVPAVPTVPAPTDATIHYLQKTDQPDIYNVYAGESQNSTREGIAFIPGLAASKMLRAVFKDRTVAVLIPFYCTYNTAFGKWTPLTRAAAAADNTPH